MKSKILFILIFLVAASACNEEILNLKNPQSKDTSIAFKNQSEIDQAVTGIYSALYHQGLFARDWYFDMDMLANEATQQPPLDPQLSGIAAGTYTATNSQIEWTWKGLYRLAFRSNFVISSVNAWTPEKDEYTSLKARYEGEARFFLGFSHYYLATLFGDVPLRKSYEETLNTQNLPRSPKATVYAFAEEQLLKAIDLLPETYATVDNGRVTKWGAKAYLGILYLQQGLFDKAQPIFEDIINNGGFSAWEGPEGYHKQFTKANRFSPESIFQIVFAIYPGALPWHFWGQWEQDWGGTTKDAASDRAMEYGWNDWKNVDIARSTVYNFKYEINGTPGYIDPRAKLTFYGDGGYGGDTDFAGGITYPFNQLQNWNWSKYQNYEDREKENVPSSEISGQMVRLNGVRLMLAECYIMQGNYTSALEQINIVRRRVGAVEYNSIPNSLGSAVFIMKDGAVDPRTTIGAMSILMREKALELTGEQQRWFDLVRWHKTWPGFDAIDVLNFEKSTNEVKPDGVTPESAFWSEKYLLLPIPQSEKDLNSEMVVPDGWNGSEG